MCVLWCNVFLPSLRERRHATRSLLTLWRTDVYQGLIHISVLVLMHSNNSYMHVIAVVQFVFKSGGEACCMRAADIVAHQDSNCMVQLVAEDIRVHGMAIHHCK